MGEFTHFDDKGNARMVDVSGKDDTERVAVAVGSIFLNEEAMQAVLGKKIKKGDVFTVAQVAGIMGAKRCSDLIPLCHILPLHGAKIEFSVDEKRGEIKVISTMKTLGKTGVEMEALTGASIALLCIYDMCKAIDKRMHIEAVHLLEKKGGKSGDFSYEEGKNRDFRYE